MQDLKFKIYKTIHNTKIEHKWRSFEEQDKQTSPFLYFDYMKYIFHYTAKWNIMYTPIIICIESQDEEILMIAALKRKICNGTLKMLGDIQGCGHTGFLFNPKLSEDEKFECLRLFIKNTKDKLRLRRIEEDSIVDKYLTVHNKDLKVSPKAFSCVKINFTEDIDSHFRALSSSVRQNIRTSYNRMKRDGIEYELKIWMPGDTMTEEMQKSMMDLYLNRLFGKYKKHRFGNIFYKTYKKIIYKNIKHDTKSLYELNNTFHAAVLVKGELICFMSGLANHEKTRIVIPRLAINEKYRFYSPGYILVYETIKSLAGSTKIREIDLSRGTERYKTDLGGKCYNTHSYTFNKQ